MILPGDVGPAVEATLGDALAPAALRVLKAAHHGSRASSTAAFLDAVHPAVVVASAGRANRHGHPDPAVVARVRERGAALYRTDRDGAIAIDTDGRWLRMTTCAGHERRSSMRRVRAGPRGPGPRRRTRRPIGLRRGGRPAGRSRRPARRAFRSEAPGRETNGTMR